MAASTQEIPTPAAYLETPASDAQEPGNSVPHKPVATPTALLVIGNWPQHCFAGWPELDGVVVVTARTPLEAKAFLQPPHQFTLIMLALEIVDSNGLEAIRDVRRCAASTPLLIGISADYKEKMGDAMRLGVQDYLYKDTSNAEDVQRALRYAIEYRRLHQIAEKAGRVRQALLAAVSHELRTPLNTIVGYSELLQTELAREANHQYAEDVEQIVSASRQLTLLISAMINAAKIESGQIQLLVQEFSLAALLADVIQVAMPLIHQNQNVLELEQPPDLGMIRSDRRKLRHILLNLLDNASKSTRQGAIRVRVSRPTDAHGEWAIFQVSDTGTGITDEQISSLFDPFFNGDSTSTHLIPGVGLGLAVTHGFSQLLQGKLTVHGNKDQGSTFVLRIPVDL